MNSKIHGIKAKFIINFEGRIYPSSVQKRVNSKDKFKRINPKDKFEACPFTS